ncbi:MAG: sulfurtransferase complex subunit TusB [Buchnera aphidicola (Periphyllus acericola)]|uniref:sulfurtransferase complex subunit TusB n=1 Tax=Buchnera aphidicola TaxID=9 RepID=UPI0030CC4535|nr:sulfurtransferase complex subunit TusB [Buchnera aphidicola (Periphyllus acericola)]
MLHTLINSPFKSNLILLKSIINAKDDFIALQDGVLISLKNNYFFKDFFFKKKYVLLNDLQARGISSSIISESFFPIDYEYFVYLTEIHSQQVIW